jgi:hypothetical protein
MVGSLETTISGQLLHFASDIVERSMDRWNCPTNQASPTGVPVAGFFPVARSQRGAVSRTVTNSEQITSPLSFTLELRNRSEAQRFTGRN